MRIVSLNLISGELADFYGLVPIWYRQDGLFCEEVPRRLAIWYRIPFVWNQVPDHLSEEAPHETLVFLIVWYRRLLFGTVWYRQDGLFCEEVPRGLAIWYRHPI